MTVTIAIGNDISGIGGHGPIGPIAGYLTGQRCVKMKASLRQRIQRRTGTPVERQEPARFSRCRRRNVGLFDDNDIVAAALRK